MTEGGPLHATELLSTYLYREAFSYYAFGTGASVGVIMIFVVLAISFFYLRFLYKRMFAGDS
jgi:ABC-type sugar transport system permease subunit